MKYRIITNGKSFKVQRKLIWFLPWESKRGYGDNMWADKVDRVFGSYTEAEDCMIKWKLDEIKEERDVWRKVATKVPYTTITGQKPQPPKNINMYESDEHYK